MKVSVACTTTVCCLFIQYAIKLYHKHIPLRLRLTICSILCNLYFVSVYVTMSSNENQFQSLHTKAMQMKELENESKYKQMFIDLIVKKKSQIVNSVGSSGMYSFLF